MKNKYVLNGLECANCASKMEDKIRKMEGVKDVSVNFMNSKMLIECDEVNKNKIIKEAIKIINKIEAGIEIEEI